MKTVYPCDELPFGLSRIGGSPGYRLKVPVWGGFGRQYDIRSDEYVTGWYWRVLVLRINFGLELRPRTPQRTEYMR